MLKIFSYPTPSDFFQNYVCIFKLTIVLWISKTIIKVKSESLFISVFSFFFQHRTPVWPSTGRPKETHGIICDSGNMKMNIVELILLLQGSVQLYGWSQNPGLTFRTPPWCCPSSSSPQTWRPCVRRCRSRPRRCSPSWSPGCLGTGTSWTISKYGQVTTRSKIGQKIHGSETSGTPKFWLRHC